MSDWLKPAGKDRALAVKVPVRHKPQSAQLGCDPQRRHLISVVASLLSVPLWGLLKTGSRKSLRLPRMKSHRWTDCAGRAQCATASSVGGHPLHLPGPKGGISNCAILASLSNSRRWPRSVMPVTWYVQVMFSRLRNRLGFAVCATTKQHCPRSRHKITSVLSGCTSRLRIPRKHLEAFQLRNE